MTLPDRLPILERSGRALAGDVYVEREITAPVDLCDARGRLESRGGRLLAAAAGAREPVRALAPQEALELLELDRARTSSSR